MHTFPFDYQMSPGPYPPNLYYCPQYQSKESFTYFPFIDQTAKFYQLQIASKFLEKSPLLSTYQCSSFVKMQEKAMSALKKCKKSKQEGKQSKRKREDSQQFKIQQVKADLKPNKKKNTESNIVNQTFSYLCSWKSKKLVATFFQNHQAKVDDYYRLMTKVKSSHKKYINRKYLKQLLQFSSQSDFYKIYLRSNMQNLGFEETRRFLNILAFNYLREGSYATLLTSSKIYKETLMEHFSRKREITRFLFSRNSMKG